MMICPMRVISGGIRPETVVPVSVALLTLRGFGRRVARFRYSL
jgi:hypothetical protein